MWNTLPNLTGSCARDANQLGVFGLVTPPITSPYQRTVLAVCHYNIVLPFITGRGVKYTHNDIKHSILHPDSGPTGIRLVPTEHTQKEIAPPHPHDPQSILGQEPAVLTPQSLRCGRTTANTRAKQVNLVMIL